MGQRQDSTTGCGRQVPNPADPTTTVSCPGTKTTVYEYDDNGNCVSQSMWPCNVCGS
ncbi:hypothetical protein [Streptomyces goshikiensis]